VKQVRDLVDQLRRAPGEDLVSRSAGLLDARGCRHVARLPDTEQSLHLVGYDPGRNRLVVVTAVPWGRRLPALLQLLGDGRLKKLCRTGQVEAQLHAWRRAPSGRLRCDTIVLRSADFWGRARGPARGRWAAATV
jgi:hypothetical protein